MKLFVIANYEASSRLSHSSPFFGVLAHLKPAGAKIKQIICSWTLNFDYSDKDAQQNFSKPKQFAWITLEHEKPPHKI